MPPSPPPAGGGRRGSAMRCCASRWPCCGTPESVIYAIGIISTVSSGALGLGAPLYRAYVTYLTCAIGGVMMAVALAGGPVMWPALFLTGVYYALTGMQARTADRAP